MPPVASLISHPPFFDILHSQFGGQPDFMALFNTEDFDIENALSEEMKDCRLIIADSECWQSHKKAIQNIIHHCHLKPTLMCLGQMHGEDFTGRILPRPLKWGQFLDEVDRRLAISRDNIAAEMIDCAPFGHINISQSKWIATNGAEVPLTDRELILLHSLASTQSGALNKRTLYKAVWGYKDDLETHTLETHIYRLRQKIEPDPQNPVIIKTREDSYVLVNHENNICNTA
jgi:hypothetical protein